MEVIVTGIMENFIVTLLLATLAVSNVYADEAPASRDFSGKPAAASNAWQGARPESELPTASML